MWEALARFAAMPDWLAALDDPTRVRAALARAIPGLREAKLAGVRLKDLTWTARCALTLQEPGGRERAVDLAATIVPPGQDEPAATPPTQGPPGGDGWRCWLPELRMELAAATTALAELPALGLLTDPEQARGLLEQAIRRGAPAYAGLRILGCTPKVMRYSPGSRCTISYRLQLPPGPDAAGWPTVVVAKTYHRADKGRIAWDAMRALWRSPLAASPTVAIAEPLAWLPDLNVLVQGPIREQQTLKALLAATLAGEGDDAELRGYLGRTAAGLAELHHCGAPSGQRATWQDELAEIHQVLGRLVPRVPGLAGAADAFLGDLERLAGRIPADPAGPAHRSFRPAQVLLDHGAIGFIDFDGFCHAEPALDLALFCATVRELGMAALPAGTPLEARLARLDGVCEAFLARYQALAPVSRERVVLWEALDLLTNVLHGWTKAKPHRLALAVPLLEHHAARVHALTAGV
jgi:hypothetical protein